MNFASAGLTGHTYADFKDTAAEKNKDVRRFFQAAFNGKTTDQRLRRVPDRSDYGFR